jgi:hypothetical protein
MQCVVLLTAALIASTATAPAESKMATAGVSDNSRNLPAEQERTPVKRFLRTSKTTSTAEDEERVFGINVPMIDDAIEGITTKMTLNGLLGKHTSADDAFGLLKVDKTADNILETKEWKNWAEYVAMRNPNDPEHSLAAAMLFRFGGDKLSNLLATAASNPTTKELATKLENAQFSRWLGSKVSPADVFKVQKLDEVTDGMFGSPAFATWSKYVKSYNEKFPAKTTSELEVLTKHYGEAGVLKMIASADDTAGPVATALKKEMVDGWLDFTIPPNNVFKLMKLDEAGDKLFTSPLLSTWVQYMKAFNGKIPRKETSMIEQFTKSYGDDKLAAMIQAAMKVDDTAEFAANLQKAQFKRWMVGEKTPDDVFMKVLKLESTSSPNADIWRAYYKAYDKEFPGRLFSFTP